MRRWLTAGIGLLLVIGFAASHMMRVSTRQPPTSAAGSAKVEAERIQLATRFLNLLDAGAYDEALDMAAPNVAEGLGAGKIRMIWEGLPARLGPRQSRDIVSEVDNSGRSVLVSRLQFRDQAMILNILFDEKNLVSGFQLEPAVETAH